jgi:hypothetical protein
LYAFPIGTQRSKAKMVTKICRNNLGENITDPPEE